MPHCMWHQLNLTKIYLASQKSIHDPSPKTFQFIFYISILKAEEHIPKSKQLILGPQG